jgi:hypothetical protein
MDKIPRGPALGIHTYHLTASQVHEWILYRDPKTLEDPRPDRRIPDADIEDLQDVIAGKPVANSRAIDALLQLLAALETGRVKSTGRRNWVGNPRLLPGHLWHYLTFKNLSMPEHYRPEAYREAGLWLWPGRDQTCACLKTELAGGGIWSDLRFNVKGVLAVWPARADQKQLEQGKEDGAIEERLRKPHRVMSSAVPNAKPELRPAPDLMIHKAISDVYSDAERTALKPPNVKEIVAPVQDRLIAAGYQASGRHIQHLAEDGKYKIRRRKPGATVASERRQKHR